MFFGWNIAQWLRFGVNLAAGILRRQSSAMLAVVIAINQSFLAVAKTLAFL
jgi:hypothetical protein